MHQLVCELTRTCEQQQALGVEVKATHGLPFTLVKTWQFAKHSRAALRVIPADDFAHRLVISQNADRHGLDAHRNRPTVDLDAIAKLYALAHMGQFIIDSDATFTNQAFHL